MSPLIDIVFLLLIFFAVTTTFLEQSGMDLELPESTTAQSTEQAGLLVEVGASGEIRFEGETITIQQLEDRVRGLAPEDRARVTVRADRTIEYGLAIEVIDASRVRLRHDTTNDGGSTWEPALALEFTRS